MVQTAQVFTDQNPTQELHYKHYQALVCHVEHVSGHRTPDQLHFLGCPQIIAQ